jgi:hypothetical protein
VDDKTFYEKFRNRRVRLAVADDDTVFRFRHELEQGYNSVPETVKEVQKFGLLALGIRL